MIIIAVLFENYSNKLLSFDQIPIPKLCLYAYFICLLKDDVIIKKYIINFFSFKVIYSLIKSRIFYD